MNYYYFELIFLLSTVILKKVFITSYENMEVVPHSVVLLDRIQSCNIVILSQFLVTSSLTRISRFSYALIFSYLL